MFTDKCQHLWMELKNGRKNDQVDGTLWSIIVVLCDGHILVFYFYTKNHIILKLILI